MAAADLGVIPEIGRDTKTALSLEAITHRMFLAVSGRDDGSRVIRTCTALNGGEAPVKAKRHWNTPLF